MLDRFAIDFSLCMYCGICVEVCPFDALFWSPEFEYSESNIAKLLHGEVAADKVPHALTSSAATTNEERTSEERTSGVDCMTGAIRRIVVIIGWSR